MAKSSVGLLLAAGAVVSWMGEAKALPLCTSGTLQSVINTGSCLDWTEDPDTGDIVASDKIYTFNDALTTNVSTFRSGRITFKVDPGIIPQEEIHNLTYTRESALPWATNPNGFSLAYTIEIDLSSPSIFKHVSLGVDVATAQNGVTTSKSVWTDAFNGSSPLSSPDPTPGKVSVVNAGQKEFNPFTSSVRKLYVIDTVKRNNPGTGNFNAFTNTFIQTNVPSVPAPLPLTGLFAAYGWTRSIRKRIRSSV